MMDEQSMPARRKNLWWLLVLLAVVLIWWWWKPPKDNGTSHSTGGADAADLAAADPDDILVDLRDSAGADRVAELERRFDIDLVLVSDQAADEQLYRAHVSPDRRDALVAELSRLADVETAEPDAEVHLIPMSNDLAAADDPEEKWKGFPNDPQYKFQWHLGQIGMPVAWRLADGDGVIVAVIDTGVASEDWKKFHRVPDLANTKMAKGYDFVNNTPHAIDDHGHGTHVAGTIAQSTHNGVGVAGVARSATIMPLKVLSAGGSGSVAAIADAIHFAADNGAKVINMSLGGRFRSKVLERAVKYAHDKGVVVVCAAGNDGSGRVSYPAAYPGAVAVAATQFDETTTFYSNYGKEIDVAAPGGNTKVDQNKDGMPDGVLQNTIVVGDPTRDGYFPFMGTSMASPHVAGVAALIVGAGVSHPDAVEKILKETAREPKGQKMDGRRYGAGIVDAPAAIRKARAETGAWQTGLAALLGMALLAGVARGRTLLGSAPRTGAGFWAALGLGSGGLFFLPYLGDVGAWLSSLPILGTLTRGFPSWDMSLLGAGGHGNVLFFSALVPLALVAVGYGVRRFHGALAGFAVGVGAHLLFHAAAPIAGVRFMVLDVIWLVANAIFCLFLAYVVLRTRTRSS